MDTAFAVHASAERLTKAGGVALALHSMGAMFVLRVQCWIDRDLAGENAFMSAILNRRVANSAVQPETQS